MSCNQGSYSGMVQQAGCFGCLLQHTCKANCVALSCIVREQPGKSWQGLVVGWRSRKRTCTPPCTKPMRTGQQARTRASPGPGVNRSVCRQTTAMLSSRSDCTQYSLTASLPPLPATKARCPTQAIEPRGLPPQGCTTSSRLQPCSWASRASRLGPAPGSSTMRSCNQQQECSSQRSM